MLNAGRVDHDFADRTLPPESGFCKSDLAVLLAQVAEVARDVGLQPQVLPVHSILAPVQSGPRLLRWTVRHRKAERMCRRQMLEARPGDGFQNTDS